MRTIAVSQLPAHLEMKHLLRICISDLVSLRLTYGALHCGMDYDRSLFGTSSPPPHDAVVAAPVLTAQPLGQTRAPQ